MGWFPGDVIVDVIPWVQECRRQGIVFRDAGGDQLAAGPQHLMDAAMTAGIRARKLAILALLREEASAGRPQQWPQERPRRPRTAPVAPEGPGEWDRLTDWLRATVLPEKPFLLNRATVVEDPARLRAYLLVEAGREPRGQVRLALLARLRLLRRLADNGWTLPEDRP